LGPISGGMAKAAEILMNSYVGLSTVSTYSPPFSFEKDEAECECSVRMIRDATPDILCIDLGPPK
jgi:N-acetylglucosaminyldiphosphoundecaprenol N-acetyl-beta-D-mannosaminyltransferase